MDAMNEQSGKSRAMVTIRRKVGLTQKSHRLRLFVWLLMICGYAVLLESESGSPLRELRFLGRVVYLV